jgi:predicted RNA-binding protein with PIN domain
MPLLIDGHNLIGQTPGISLADADDEAQLVMLLRRYATRKRGRQVVVIFDGGVYGHPHDLNGYGVTCHFAKSPRDADIQLIKRLNALTRPADWTLITSDHVVADAARQRGVRVISSQQFAAQLLAPDTPTQASDDEKPEQHLSEQEIEEWLNIFDKPPGSAPPTAAPRDKPARKQRRRKRET